MINGKNKIDIERLYDDVEARRYTLISLFAGFGQQVAAGKTWLTDMPFNVRCHNCLRQAGMEILADLNSVSVDQLLSYPAFGWGTLNHLLGVYAKSFEASFSGCETFVLAKPKLMLEWHEDDDSTYGVLTEEKRLDAAFRAQSLVSLKLSLRSRTILDKLNVSTIGDLLHITPGQVIGRSYGIREIATEIREKLSLFVERFVLSKVVQDALVIQPLNCTVLEAAATAFGIPQYEVRTRILSVSGVVIVADHVYWVPRCEGVLFPKWEYESYFTLLMNILEEVLSTRQIEVLSDYYGLFSEPLSRKELSEKQCVAPQRIYQILKKSEDRLATQPSLIDLLWLPVRELMRQHPGVLSARLLEHGLVQHFGCAAGQVRVEGLLALIQNFTDEIADITIFDDKLVLQRPVTEELLRDIVGFIYTKLLEVPSGISEERVQQIFLERWGLMMPGHPAPYVTMADLAGLHPKINIEEKCWSVRQRRIRGRITDRLTRLGQIETILIERGYPMQVQDLFDACRDRYGEINIPASRTALKKNEHLFRAYERGIYGLVGWREYSSSEIEALRLNSRRNMPRTIRDKIEAVLEEAGLPMHFHDLFDELQKRFGENDERAVRSALFVCPERFQSYGNGVFSLTSWGEDAASLLEEAVADFLVQRGYPASETEICDGLHGQFQISVPVCRWALRKAWERAGSVVPLDGGLWDLADVEAAKVGTAGISIDDLLLEQLLSC